MDDGKSQSRLLSRPPSTESISRTVDVRTRTRGSCLAPELIASHAVIRCPRSTNSDVGSHLKRALLPF